MSDKPLTEAQERRKQVWERHKNGETYANIAHGMGITPSRVRELALAWERHLKSVSKPDGKK